MKIKLNYIERNFAIALAGCHHIVGFLSVRLK